MAEIKECPVCGARARLIVHDGMSSFSFEALCPRWISVVERLPEDDADVLVYAVSNDDKSRDSCIAMTSYTHNMHGFNIEGWRPPWQYFFYNYMITHWMPLPQPPKEENHEV